MGVTQYRLAKEIGVPQRRIGEIVAGKRAITADTAARLGAPRQMRRNRAKFPVDFLFELTASEFANSTS